METYVKDADDIWVDYKTQKKNSTFADMTIEAQLDVFQKKYRKFTTTFPIVLRYMVQAGAYRRKAFVKFIKKMQACPYHSQVEYCERQADYVKYLYMELIPNYTMDNARAVWTETNNLLTKELESFQKAADVASEKIKKNNIADNISRRKELKLALKSL